MLMEKITMHSSEMYKYLMCKDAYHVITVLSSEMIENGCFNKYGYIFDTEEECENFWKNDLKRKIRVTSKINILDKYGRVRLVEIIDDDDDYYEDIDISSLEFVRMAKVQTEIHAMNYDKLLKAYIYVYYPVLRVKAADGIQQ